MSEVLQTVENLFSQPVVSTDEFHRVYGEFLASELSVREDINRLFDLALHNTGTSYDDQLLRDGKISTVGMIERYSAPQNIACEGLLAAWVTTNIPFEKRLRKPQHH